MPFFVFDVDDTLYDRSLPFVKTYKELRYDSQYPDVRIRDVYAASCRWGDVMFEESQSGKMSMEEYYCLRFQKGFRDAGIEISKEEAGVFQEQYRMHQGQIELSDTMEKVLLLCTGTSCGIGIVTNGPVDHQREKISHLGMERWVPEKYMIVSAACGYSKPDRAIFEYAAKQFEADVEKIWYIGDSYENDVCGAAKANWKSIWLNRTERKLEDGMIRPDFEVRDENELYRCIRQILKENEMEQ